MKSRNRKLAANCKTIMNNKHIFIIKKNTI